MTAVTRGGPLEPSSTRRVRSESVSDHRMHSQVTESEALLREVRFTLGEGIAQS